MWQLSPTAGGASEMLRLRSGLATCHLNLGVVGTELVGVSDSLLRFRLSARALTDPAVTCTTLHVGESQ